VVDILHVYGSYNLGLKVKGQNVVDVTLSEGNSSRYLYLPAGVTVGTLKVDYIYVTEMTKDNLCTVVGLPDMIVDFKEGSISQRPTSGIL